MWWIFSVLSAGAQVARNVVMKDLGHKLDEYINVWGRFTFLLPFALVATLYVGIPELKEGFWVNSILAGLLVAISTIYLSKAFKCSDISIATVLWKVNIVIILLAMEIFLMGESVTLWESAGIFVTLLGVYLLNIEKVHVSWYQPIKQLFAEDGLKYAVIAGSLLAPATFFFRKTVLLSDVFFPTFMNWAFASLFMLPLVLIKSRKHLKVVHMHSKKFFSMGFLAFLTNLTGNAAYALTLATYVEAVKQIEVLFALFVGALFYKEHERVKEIWPGCTIIMLGILILIFSGS